MEIGKAILGDTSLPGESLQFSVVVHFATALSTIIVFRKDVADIFRGLIKREDNSERIFSLKIILSIIPAAIIGIFLRGK